MVNWNRARFLVTHVFVLVIVIGGAIDSQDMYFWDINRCNYFASKSIQRHGAPKSKIPEHHQAIAYCKPKLIDTTTIKIYD